MKRKSGQILILILLIVVVALAVGLSVASRNITNLRTSTQAEHSQRALSAAEGGVEDILSRLTEVANNIKTGVPVPGCTGGLGPATCTVQVGNINANVVVKAKDIYESTIEPGEVGQVDLKDATGITDIQIEWAKKNTPEADDPASIEVTLLKNNSGVYSQTRKAWSGGGHLSEEVNFSSPSNCVDEYSKCASIPFESGSIILRIKPFWNRTTVKVTCGGSGCSFPTQIYEIVSEAQTEIGVTRKIQVTRTALPQLPAAFDYVLYSEGDITK